MQSVSRDGQPQRRASLSRRGRRRHGKALPVVAHVHGNPRISSLGVHGSNGDFNCGVGGHLGKPMPKSVLERRLEQQCGNLRIKVHVTDQPHAPGNRRAAPGRLEVDVLLQRGQLLPQTVGGGRIVRPVFPPKVNKRSKAVSRSVVLGIRPKPLHRRERVEHEVRAQLHLKCSVLGAFALVAHVHVFCGNALAVPEALVPFKPGGRSRTWGRRRAWKRPFRRPAETKSQSRAQGQPQHPPKPSHAPQGNDPPRRRLEGGARNSGTSAYSSSLKAWRRAVFKFRQYSSSNQLR